MVNCLSAVVSSFVWNQCLYGLPMSTLWLQYCYPTLIPSSTHTKESPTIEQHYNCKRGSKSAHIYCMHPSSLHPWIISLIIDVFCFVSAHQITSPHLTSLHPLTELSGYFHTMTFHFQANCIKCYSRIIISPLFILSLQPS